MLHPLGSRVVAKLIKSEEILKGKIILSAGAEKGQSAKAEVIAVGPGDYLKDGTRKKVSVQVGDTVLFPSYSSTEITLGNEDFIILNESDILAIIK